VTRRGHLTPDDLDREPQLAVLFALDAALWAARMALFSVHAELREPETEADVDTTTAIARTLVRLLDDLGPVLEAYRHALERPSRRRLPFDGESF
jgi:hypothetical protein